MDDAALMEEFSKYKSDPEMAIAVAVINALTGVIKRSTASTMMELEIGLRAAADKLKTECLNTEKGVSSISLTAGCELFLRHVTRCFLEFDDFEKCKAMLIERGAFYGSTSLTSRNRISELGHSFIRDGMVVLTHGASRVVAALLCRAAKEKHFSVIVTESRPECDGYSYAKTLASAGILTTVIADSAIGYAMEKTDLVIVGAGGVVENGGIVNRIGTFTCAMVANALNKPFYVAVESYKFARIYPLHQRDFPHIVSNNETVSNCDTCAPKMEHPNIMMENPTGDYTPPQYITLLFTDLGVLTPSAVSDELIQLYQ